MRVNRQDLSIVRGTQFAHTLAYTEGGRRALVDFSRCVLEAYLTCDGQKVPLSAAGVSLGKIKLHLSDDRSASMECGRADFDLYVNEIGATAAPKLAFSGYATILDPEVRK